jgi:hypothetical protein
VVNLIGTRALVRVDMAMLEDQRAMALRAGAPRLLR